LWMEGSQDWRDMLAGAQNMNDAIPGSATYFQVTYGGGAHCCWNTEYEPSVTWTKASNPNISQVVGTGVPMNVWQWMLRQGDTSMPGGVSAPAAAAPAASAGVAQTITLPTNTANLTGSGTGNDGAKISSMAWAQTSGPNNANIKPGNLVSGATMNLPATVSGMIAGNYTFQLTVKDNKGMVTTSSVTVTVKAAPPPTSASNVTKKVPPTVSAGSNQAITLPTNSVTLTGKATGNGGAVVNSYFWVMVSGPSYVKFSNEWALSTTVSGLVAGTYVLELSASDTYYQTSTSVMTVTVDAAKPAASKPATPPPSTPANENGQGSAKTPPTVNAGKGQKITLPTSSTTLAGSAAGTSGAKVVTISWAQVAGPEKAKIASPATISTAVTGMTEAGDYIFQLIAIDNNGKSSNGSVTVAVEPAIAKVPPTVNAGANQTITLPTSSATLKGSATAHNGAVVNSYFWVFVSGPSWVKFSNEWELTTTVSGLVAGTYVLQLSASDNNDETSTSTMELVVKPKSAVAGASTGATAETGNAAALTDPVSPDSIDRAGGLVIFPNPVHDLLNLRLANNSNGKLLIRIIDGNGRLVQASTTEKRETSIDVSKLNKGVYVIELMTDSGGITTRRFIKL